ncbi:tumor protein p53-inducible nuclear protein 2 isoform X2 [Lingula anatina]|uniref:Tumor protein p53-inducible nuclear protein 2 isoform X2 n=1 Tax=Lingula anatina TaxID=7574 RepID=A0A1S3K201_LINAN|nr:tumor protein p53-inducible nuclear protein 2 isoform X2 [Lingula anatina]|eukprot:XP_013416424.1 tumor protein p53-inducible nuclear protein 2 isoform X2 [Lingula anatina]
MLSGLSNLIFGAGPEEAPHEAVDLKTTLAENEWVLVDRTRSSRLETGPMENLLIEHPSMSVYGPRPRGSSTGADDSLDSESSTENEQNRPVIHRPPHRPRAVAARAGLVAAQAQAVKSMQRSHHQVTTRNLRKKQLTRANQVHERFSNAKALHQRKIKQPGTRKQQH